MSRIDKINEEVRRELAQVIRNLKDSRIPMMTSVVSVSVTNDLRYAKAYISVMGDKETQKKAMVSSLAKMAQMYSYISPQSRAKASSLLKKAST